MHISVLFPLYYYNWHNFNLKKGKLHDIMQAEFGTIVLFILSNMFIQGLIITFPHLPIRPVPADFW